MGGHVNDILRSEAVLGRFGRFVGRNPKLAQNDPNQLQINKVYKTDPHYFCQFMGGHVYIILRFEAVWDRVGQFWVSPNKSPKTGQNSIGSQNVITMTPPKPAKIMGVTFIAFFDLSPPRAEPGSLV